MTIDGKTVLSAKDLSEGNDHVARVFKIAKEKSYPNTYLSLERVVSGVRSDIDMKLSTDTTILIHCQHTGAS